MPAPTQDGVFSSATQNGAAQVDFPLQSQGEYYARTITRECVALAAVKKASSANAFQVLTNYTNALTYSEQLNNGAGWTLTAITISADGVANPVDGTLNADSVFETVANSTHFAQSATAITFSAATYTLSCFFKQLGRQFAGLVANDGTSSFVRNFDLTNGLIGTAAGTGTASGTITDMGNGWWRATMSFSPAAASGGFFVVTRNADNTSAYVGDVTKGVIAWGLQLEATATAGPYISTTTVARTISAPAVDSIDAVSLGALNPGDPFAYLVSETAPNSSDLLQGFARWTREYARVPKDVTVYSTIAITKPGPNTQAYTLTQGPAGTVIGNASLWNNASGTPTYFFLPLALNNKFGAFIPCTSANSGSDTNLTVASTAAFNAANDLCINVGVLSSIEYWPSGSWSITSGTIIKLTGATLGGNVSQVGQTVRSYVPGVSRLKTKRISSYYLPGVTAGITTAADISVPAVLLNDASFLSLVASTLSGYSTYDADPLAFWLGQIYVQTVIQIDMATV